MVTRSGKALEAKKQLRCAGKVFSYYSIKESGERLSFDVARLPNSLKIVLENLLRYQDDVTVTQNDIKAFVSWIDRRTSQHEIAYRPSRVLMQDFTGVPAVVDLAAMRDAVQDLDIDPSRVSPAVPVDLVIDHSVQVDQAASDAAFRINVQLEMERNMERYKFLRWGQKAFDNFRVVPPGTGICHQVNLEYLAKVVWTRQEGEELLAYPDTLIGTDSHTTMINGLGVLGWGVGGIEAEAAMLGQPISMIIPEVIGFKLTGNLQEGVTATDLVLHITQILRTWGVVGKFVEFFGEGLESLSLADRATIANMAPEYGATCGLFPVDERTLEYLRLTGRDEETVALVERYCKEQLLWRQPVDPIFTDTLDLNLKDVEPSLAGPKRPQDRVSLAKASEYFIDIFENNKTSNGNEQKMVWDSEGGHICDNFSHFDDDHVLFKSRVPANKHSLGNGDVVIAAITSCTNTSNPSVMIAAGLLARNAVLKGLKTKPWVKTSLAPGSRVVTEYLAKSGLQEYLDKLGFYLVGYGCTTCIGNSGPLPQEIVQAISENNLKVAAVLSGNRNFEGRIHPLTQANYLASPPLVVAYALAGSMKINLTSEPIGRGSQGNLIYLKDIWPSAAEINKVINDVVNKDMFIAKYSEVFSGDEDWQNIMVNSECNYSWDANSTYIKKPPYFTDVFHKNTDNDINININGANILAILGDSITTDHISPAGNIPGDSPAGTYLNSQGVASKDFNSYGARRGNHEVMLRGTFANIRLQNEMTPERKGGYTIYIPTGDVMSIYDAAVEYKANNKAVVVIAGKEYGTGSSRDWAAKGTALLGVKVVIAENFERIHRSNLIGMGVLPLMFKDGQNRKSLDLDGSETIDIICQELKPGLEVECNINRRSSIKETIHLICRIDTDTELEYYASGGILHKVIKEMA